MPKKADITFDFRDTILIDFSLFSFIKNFQNDHTHDGIT